MTFYLQLDDQFLRDVTAISSDLAQDFLGSQTLMGAESPIWSAGQLSSLADEGAGALRPGISGPFSWPVCTSRCRSPVRTARQTCGLSIAFVTEGSTVLRILNTSASPPIRIRSPRSGDQPFGGRKARDNRRQARKPCRHLIPWPSLSRNNQQESRFARP